jgi:hypothetical protein
MVKSALLTELPVLPTLLLPSVPALKAIKSTLSPPGTLCASSACNLTLNPVSLTLYCLVTIGLP